MGAVCKTVAKASEVRILHPPQVQQTAPDLGDPGSGADLVSPNESHWLVLAQRSGGVSGKAAGPRGTWVSASRFVGGGGGVSEPEDLVGEIARRLELDWQYVAHVPAWDT